MIAMQLTALAQCNCSKAERYLERLAGAPASGRDRNETLHQDQPDGVGIRRRRARDAFANSEQSGAASIQANNQANRMYKCSGMTSLNF
jgi:hypothetical protein